MERNFRKNKKMKKKLVAVMVSTVMLTTSGFGTNFSSLNNVLDVRNVYAAEDVDMSVIEACQNSGHEVQHTFKQATCFENATDIYNCVDCSIEAVVVNEGTQREHSWDNVNGALVESTCITKGGTVRTCTYSDCGYQDWIGEREPLSSHAYGFKETISPTCTEGGYTLEECSVCHVVTREVNHVYALGHDYYSTYIEPSCDTQGYTLHQCIRCESSYKDAYEASTGHSFKGKVESINEATCLSDGSSRIYCENCKASQVIIVPKLGHEYEATVISPTCLLEGYTLYKCIRCSDEYSNNPFEAVGHNFITTTILPTTTSMGYTEVRCTNSGCTESSKNNYIAATPNAYFDYKTLSLVLSDKTELMKYSLDKGNTWVTTEAVSVQFTEKEIERLCASSEIQIIRSGNKEKAIADSYVQTIELIREDDPSKLIWVKQPEEGESSLVTGVNETMEYRAVNSNQWISVVGTTIENLEPGEYYIRVKGTDSTFSSVFVRFLVLEPLHITHDQLGTVTIVKEPTCEQTGTSHIKCSKCDYYTVKIINPLGHNMEFYAKQQPTCTKKGYDIEHCTRCDYTNQTNFVSTVAHEYINKEIVEPTCTKMGYTIHQCKNCDSQYKDSYTEPTSHVYTIKEQVNATCTESGYIIEECSVCAASGKGKSLPSLGHTYTSTIIKPTYTAQGYTLHKCVNCDSEYRDSYVPAIGNGFEYDETKFEIDENGVLIKYIGIDINIVIPEGVTGIGNNAFGGCSSMVSVTIPITVINIGWKAFNGCSGLKDVIIPNGVTSIGEAAFSGCSELTSITIPDSVTSISQDAFEECSNLSTIKCFAGSSAEAFAVENGYTCVPIDNEEPDDIPSSDPDVNPSKPIKDKNFYNVTKHDDDITLSDAQLILRYALRIENSEVDYTLSDAQTCLRIALRIIVL